MSIIPIIIIQLVFITVTILLLFSMINVGRTQKMYRLNYGYKNGNASGAASQECPWKWLAVYRLKKLIKNDQTIYHAYVEDISEGKFDYDTCCGKIVWEWEK